MANHFKNKYLLIIVFLVIILVITWMTLFRLFSSTMGESLVTQNLFQNHSGQQTSVSPTTPALKTYRNEEYDFEFQYPENWTFHANTFYSPFSNFNLVGAPSGEDYQLDPPILVNIVTLDFSDRAVISRKNLGAVESDIVVGSINGIEYRYMEEYSRISIDIPVGEFRMILGSKKPYEGVFSQILTSFKFLK